jgi:hypothetical protein
MSEEKKQGDTVIVCAQATIVRTSNAHGLCYQVELGKHDFDSHRLVWVNPEETLTARARELIDWALGVLSSDYNDVPHDEIAALRERLTPHAAKKEQK